MADRIGDPWGARTPYPQGGDWPKLVKRTLLLLGRRGKGEQAVKGTYAEQIANVAHEPGVRQQL
jgi:hypothetical protein